MWSEMHIPAYPSIHPMLFQCISQHIPAITQCCFNVGPASKTVGQHWNSIEWISRVCRIPLLMQCIFVASHHTITQIMANRWTGRNPPAMLTCMLETKDHIWYFNKHAYTFIWITYSIYYQSNSVFFNWDGNEVYATLQSSAYFSSVQMSKTL